MRRSERVDGLRGPVAAGVDGFGGRWVMAFVTGRTLRVALADTAVGVLAATRDCAGVGIDVPIGLAEDGRRRCDSQARALLPGVASSVFPAPARAVLGATDYGDAVSRSRAAAAGRAISKQTWFITPGIADFAGADVDHLRVVEVHPEVAFRAMGPATTYAPKRTTRGQGQRIAALSVWVDLAAGIADLPTGPALHDVLDAVACAWSAWRWCTGTATVLGGELDSTGAPMRIVV